jgi:adenylosuccinate lyase
MPASPADSAIYRSLFSDDEAARLFTDSAEIRAMLLVEGALARVQGKLRASLKAKHRAVKKGLEHKSQGRLTKMRRRRN